MILTERVDGCTLELEDTWDKDKEILLTTGRDELKIGMYLNLIDVTRLRNKLNNLIESKGI